MIIYIGLNIQSYKNCKNCKDKGELRLKSIRHDDIKEDEMPEGGWECSECGAPVENMNDYCSQRCFNAGMR